MRQRVKILLVDDQERDLLVLEAVLEPLGEELVTARSGAEALRKVQENDFSVIILDVWMPDLGGFETAARIRECARCRNTPIIIFYTGVATDEIRMFEGYKAGAVDYLLKPVAPEVLRSKVAVFVELTKQAELLEQRVQERTAELAGANERLAAEIRERKRAEEEREQLLAREQAAREEADRANRLKDVFLATISHELRTPLTAILGWSRMLRSRKMDEAARDEAVEVICRNAKAQVKLIEDILDVSRIITGKVRLDVHPVDLPPVIEAAMDAVRPAAQEKGVSLHMSVDLRAGAALGDPDRLQQVIWNLLSNAIKFTPAGGSVSIKLQRINSQVEIAVVDTGQGIRADFLPHLFERFRQAEDSTARTHGGLGLGLAIVRHLVELHGGTVRGESPGEGRGATFAVTIPSIHPSGIQSVSAGAAERAQAGTQTTGKNFECPALLDGLRLLVVDDDPDAGGFIASVLTQSGAQVTTAASTAEALKALEHLTPDALVADIGMPREDGYALIREIREREARSGAVRMPAIALTAYAGVEDRLRALDAGYQMHVAKPVEPTELAMAVANLVGRAEAA